LRCDLESATGSICLAIFKYFDYKDIRVLTMRLLHIKKHYKVFV
jgi:hypothetical protein